MANTAWAAELELGNAMVVDGWEWFAVCSLVGFMLRIVSGVKDEGRRQRTFGER